MTQTRVERAMQELIKGIRENGGADCESYPEIFFPEDYNSGRSTNWDVQFAKKVCSTCPLQQQCLTYAFVAQEAHGIWGGLTAAERLQKKHRLNKYNSD